MVAANCKISDGVHEVQRSDSQSSTRESLKCARPNSSLMVVVVESRMKEDK